MKKLVQKQVEVYCCDYCGKECEHTPEYKLPIRDYRLDDCIKCDDDYASIVTAPIQRDICPECQEKIYKLLTLIDKFTFEEDNAEKIVARFNNEPLILEGHVKFNLYDN